MISETKIGTQFNLILRSSTRFRITTNLSRAFASACPCPFPASTPLPSHAPATGSERL